MNSSTLLRAAPRAVGAAALFGAMLAVPVGAVAAPAPAGEACVGDEGVTVVVDFTDLGGEIEVACAEGAPDSGREALEAAGFTPEDSEPGMICTIDDQPDPCPEEFDGNFWSYWHAEAGGDWESYMVGADESEPAPGEIEGWRYSTGEEGPQITPAALLGEDAGEDGDTGASEDADTGAPAETDDSSGEAGTEEDTGGDDTGDTGEDTSDAANPATDASDGESSTGMWIGIVAGIAIIGAVIAMLVRRRNQLGDLDE